MRTPSKTSVFAIPSTLLALTGYAQAIYRVPTGEHPNILVIMVDQMQTPPEGYGAFEGAAQGLKEVLGFRPITQGNTYTSYFQGMMRLRQNAVVLKKHYTASSASVPSRCCIMTGQYPTITGVTQTDGLFKSAEDVPFLDPIGTPTIGDWFRLAGYSTHYFGKWHVSEAAAPDYLEPWGFADWASSSPEPHGGTSDNLGTYRDMVFADNAVEFINQQANNPSTTPWLAVASFVNPHDISAYPVNWMVPDTLGVVPWVDYPPPTSIPAMGDTSLPGVVPTILGQDTTKITVRVPLNPNGFPQQNSFLPPTFYETLVDKPDCQFDYSYKWGLAYGGSSDYTFQSQHQPYRSPLPFQLQDSLYEAWSLSYLQFYFYCQYLADLQIRRVLQALDHNHLTNNTIVVFISDHGEMAAAHGGMIQKWHNAYEETVRVPWIISSPLVNSDEETMREISEPTSSIDFAPTLLGLAGFNVDSLQNVGIQSWGSAVSKPFPGIDLSSYLEGSYHGPIVDHNGNIRNGVLFMSDDMITELGDSNKIPQYDYFLHQVDSTINLGYHLTEGTVRQPNNVQAFCTGDWKLVQYVDPKGVEQDQWEFYCLTNDPTEIINLVDYQSGEVKTGATVPDMTHDEIVALNALFKQELENAMGVTHPDFEANRFTLFQNVPNPVQEQTTLSFFIPEEGAVRLTISDISGKELKVVENRRLHQGAHNYEVATGSLKAGVYFVGMTYQNQHQVKKMVVLH